MNAWNRADKEMALSIILEIRLSLPVGCDYREYRNLFLLSDNRDYFLHKIDHNNLGVLAKCILQNNNEIYIYVYVHILQHVL